MNVKIFPGKLEGTLCAPPSKSMAHRCLMAAGLARGQSRVEGLEFSQDISATCRCLEGLGAKIKTGKDWALVEGMGFPHPAAAPLDCGESGSTLRFFIPLAGLLGSGILCKEEGKHTAEFLMTMPVRRQKVALQKDL